MGIDLSTNKKGLLCVVSGIVLFFNDINLEHFLLEPLSVSFVNVKLFEKLGIALTVSGLVIIFDKLPYVSLWKKIIEVSEQIKDGFSVIKSANDIGINDIFVRHVNNIQTKRFEDKRFEDKIIKEIKRECSRKNNDGEILISCVAAMDFFSKNGPMIGETIFSLFGNLKNKCKLKVLILSPDSEGAKLREKLEPQHPLIHNIKSSIENLKNLRILFNWNEILDRDYSRLKNLLEQSLKYKLNIQNIKVENDKRIKLDNNSDLTFFGTNLIKLVINTENFDLNAENENGIINATNPNVEFRLYDFLPPVFLIITHDFAFIETYPMYKVENQGESIGGRCPMLMVRNKTNKGETETYRRWKKHFYYIWENMSHNLNEKKEKLLMNSVELFCWDDIIRKNNLKLLDFLKQNYGEGLAKKAEIEMKNDNKTIRITTGKNIILLNLKDENSRVELLIDDGINDELMVRTENGRRNIYQSYVYPANIRNVIESIQNNVCSNCYRTPTIHFSKGFETHDLYKTILELSQHRLWIFGRKNRKLFDRENYPFIDKILEKKSRQQFDWRVLFISPNAPKNIIDKAHINKNFKEELILCINVAKEYFEERGRKNNIKFNDICKCYSKERCNAMIIIDDAVIFSRIKKDENGVTKKLTNESFEIVSTDSTIGKNLVSRFEETWIN
ncbi:hypothetical protein METP2_02935 [Methanosarcinales archaeon]|uniref:hypothetical protein n=1 Tax=Candidatus Methanoperedens sp. BLZ2 TaxID=2035255 RepID=UPI000BE47440|nr:hypothetical protein [Candidatus Methanoperedens sp. BLZ2]KAB2947461.1 MAG: hypothetical protein F9K14_03330 [Candidatus Methanoperedens sp.]MBZ0175172.1 hypothetical protein [Candidatus Methanoperedens nitroreducens]CAG0996280.1 hypothetical protein METP2_02935 [Methanosarcinales archaeon]MCX9078735.1 hypothetical protein [Candidatus Methanoperedens sp.]MCX9086515.1 hypothetical protein [Candidatus Methanoperedens sp.]